MSTSDPVTRLNAALEGRYRIERRLGEGGMATVYLASDLRHGRNVALKVLKADLSAAVDAERFLSEIRTTATLQHPNILPLFDSGEVDSSLFYTMPYVEDGTLADRLAKGPPFEVSEAVRLITDVGEALQLAHERGVVHRDIKPSNILLSRGKPLVADFGIARVADLTHARLTETGISIGTVGYMSPEQATGEGDVDARADLYSLACVLFEMLSGKPPFGDGRPLAILARQATEPAPPVRAGRPDLPDSLARAIATALAREPDGRFSSTSEFVASLSVGTASPVREVPSVAVLPFANMSADAENEYFCDGIAEEITSALSKVGQLQVAGRTSAFSFKGKAGDLREIGQALNVGTVLEGSVRKAGDRLRITAQLIKVVDGYHLWSERYDRQLKDIFDIQDEIALAVAEALKVTLLGREKEAVLKRSTDDPEAYRLCLQARHVWQRWTDEGFRAAIGLFNEAIARDPHNALAHNGLADCYLAWNLLGREPMNVPKIRTLFETAIELNPNAGLAYAVYGGIVNGVSVWDWPLAEAHCHKGAELAPREGHVWSVYGILMGLLGRHDEAVTMHRRAVELDPISAAWNAFLVFGLLPTRDWEAALRETERTLAILPEFWLVLMFAGQAHGACGRWDEAVATFERAVRSSGGVPYASGLLGYALARAGRRDEARRQLAQLRDHAESHYVPATALAFVHAGLDERDEAFALLANALDVHDHWAVFSLTLFPVLDDLRPDPRFAVLRGRLGLT